MQASTKLGYDDSVFKANKSDSQMKRQYDDGCCKHVREKRIDFI